MLENETGEGAREGQAGAAFGLVAALVALAFLWAMSRAAPTVAFPPLALAERIVRLAPGDAATVATRWSDGLMNLNLYLLHASLVR